MILIFLAQLMDAKKREIAATQINEQIVPNVSDNDTSSSQNTDFDDVLWKHHDNLVTRSGRWCTD